jgi:hypothetical protein
MIEMTGYDATNRRGFKKVFFETTKDGKRTRNAEVSDGLKQDDWVEVTMDDSSYKNVQSIKVIAEPAGQDVPAQGGGGNAPGTSQRNHSSDKMSKAEWAAKDRKKEVSVSRSVAVKSAALLFTGKGATKAIVDSLEKLAYRMEAYLLKGAFDADLDAEPVELPPAPEQPATQTTPAGQGDGAPINEDGGNAPDDDDIPF